jgi:hypothetical protein
MSDTQAKHSKSIQNLEKSAIVSNNVDSIESTSEPVEKPVAKKTKSVAKKPKPVAKKPEPKVEEPKVEEPKVEEPVTEPKVVKSDDICSLKTLINVLGQWSNNEIRRRNVETLLKEGTEVDENLDNIEKTVEVLKLWITDGASTFKSHDHFLNMDGYTLVDESKNLSEEKKVEVLKTLTELVINVSNRRISDEERDNVLKNL